MTLADPLGTLTPKRTRATGSKVLLILGCVLVVAAIIGGRMGIDRAQSGADGIRDDADEIRNGFLVEVPVPGEDEVDLETGRYTIYAVRSTDLIPRNPTSTTASTTLPPPVTDGSATVPPADPDEPDPYDVDLTVTDPNGREVRTQSPRLDSLLTGLSGNFIGMAEFRVAPGDEGTYTLRGDGTGADLIAIGPTPKGGHLGEVIGGGLLTGLAFLLGGLGFVLALAGLIWFLVSDTRPKPPLPPVPAGWGPPGWGPPPPANPGAPGLTGWVPPPSAPSHRPPPPPAPPPGPWGAGPPIADDPPRWSPPAGPDDPSRRP